jgi:ribosomal protein L22
MDHHLHQKVKDYQPRAKDALMFLKKRHVLDAINRLERSPRKVAKVMVRTFYNLLDHAKRQGLNPTRLWVHGCIIGLTKRYRGVRYQARGRGYREKRDFCQVKVILW